MSVEPVALHWEIWPRSTRASPTTAMLGAYRAMSRTMPMPARSCGYCERGCTHSTGDGWQSHSPRGKWYFLKEVMEGREKLSQKDIDRFLVCTTCERCDVALPARSPHRTRLGQTKGQVINEGKKMTFPAFEMMAASARKEKNIWAAYAKDRDAWCPMR